MRSYAVLAALAAALSATSALAQRTAVSDAGADAGPNAGGSLDAGTAVDGGSALGGGLADGGAAPLDLSSHDAALKAQILKELQAQEDQKLGKMRDELKDEIRAEMTTAQAQPQEAEELPEEKPRLQFFEVNGYFRVRPNLYENLWLGWSAPDPLNSYLFPKPYSNSNGKTEESTDTRFRVEPTLNVSEDIQIHSQIDVLDNLVLGSTPELSTAAPMTILSQSQVPPSSSLGNLQQSTMQVKRAWAEVTLPGIFGQLRFGRMGNHWGMGMYQNDGNCLDCDYGNTVDRVMLVLKIANHLIMPMMDWVGAGALYNMYSGDQLGQPVSFDRPLEAYQYGLQILRKDTDKELKELEERGKPSINYGGYFTLRTQSDDLMWQGPNPLNPSVLPGSGYQGVTSSLTGTCNLSTQSLPSTLGQNPNSATFNNQVAGLPPTICGVDARNATFVVPDVWFRLKTKRLRLETELVYVHGNFTINANDGSTNDVNHAITVNSFGGAFQGEYKFLSDLQLSVGLDLGLATGNETYGFGIQPGRTSPFGAPTPQGAIDGNPISCQHDTEPCEQSNINAFSFSPDYRIDQILWRQILGSITDAWFVKPTIKYRFLPGLEAAVSGIYSQAQRPQFTPGGQAPLGLEGDVGVHYNTEDGFVANLDYGILVPLSGLNEVNASGVVIGTSVAQTIRLLLGVRY